MIYFNLSLQTRGHTNRAHTNILVNDVRVIQSYNWDQDVGDVDVSPAAVLLLHAGDLVRVSNVPSGWTGNIGGDPTTMYTWFSITLLYAED